MIYKNNGGKVWWVMFRDPSRPGKFIRKSTRTESVREARMIEESLHLAIKKKMDAMKVKSVFDTIFGEKHENKLTLAEFWPLYEQFVQRRDREPGAQLMKQRKKNIDDFINWASENRNIKLAEEVNFECAIAYTDFLKRKTKLKDKTRKEYVNNLSTIWNAVAAFHKITNPWKDIRPVVRDGLRRSAFTREQEKAVLDASLNSRVPRWYEACLIARWTGLRKHDIALLEWKSVDFNKGIIRTTPIKTQGYDIEVEIPMVQVLRDALLRLYKPGRKYVLPEFANVYPGDPDNCSFSSILKAAGIDDESYTFHSWRHTFRTRLAEAGISNDLAKRLGGWTQDSTVQRYDHADKTDEIRQALETTSAPRPRSGSDISCASRGKSN